MKVVIHFLSVLIFMFSFSWANALALSNQQKDSFCSRVKSALIAKQANLVEQAAECAHDPYGNWDLCAEAVDLYYALKEGYVVSAQDICDTNEVPTSVLEPNEYSNFDVMAYTKNHECEESKNELRKIIDARLKAMFECRISRVVKDDSIQLEKCLDAKKEVEGPKYYVNNVVETCDVDYRPTKTKSNVPSQQAPNNSNYW